MDGNYEIRAIRDNDAGLLGDLQRAMPQAFPPTEPSPLSLSDCSEVRGETCFVALERGKPVACILGFVRGHEGYCTTLVAHPGSAQSAAVSAMLARFASAMADLVDTCWIAAAEEEDLVRSLCRMLGTHGIGVRAAFGVSADSHIAARIDRARRERSHGDGAPPQT